MHAALWKWLNKYLHVYFLNCISWGMKNLQTFTLFSLIWSCTSDLSSHLESDALGGFATRILNACFSCVRAPFIFPHLGIGDFFIKRIFSRFATFLRKIDCWEKNVQIWSFTWDHILELHTSALPQFLLPIDRYLCFRFLLHRFFPDFASPMGRQLSRLINNDTIRKKKDWGKSYILKSGIHCSNSDFYWFYLHKKEKELSPEVKMLHGQLFSHIFT